MGISLVHADTAQADVPTSSATRMMRDVYLIFGMAFPSTKPTRLSCKVRKNRKVPDITDHRHVLSGAFDAVRKIPEPHRNLFESLGDVVGDLCEVTRSRSLPGIDGSLRTHHI